MKTYVAIALLLCVLAAASVEGYWYGGYYGRGLFGYGGYGNYGGYGYGRFPYYGYGHSGLYFNPVHGLHTHSHHDFDHPVY